jgi:hypothetical protein
MPCCTTSNKQKDTWPPAKQWVQRCYQLSKKGFYFSGDQIFGGGGIKSGLTLNLPCIYTKLAKTKLKWKIYYWDAGFEVLAVVTVMWCYTTYSVYGHWDFKGMYCLHLNTLRTGRQLIDFWFLNVADRESINWLLRHALFQSTIHCSGRFDSAHYRSQMSCLAVSKASCNRVRKSVLRNKTQGQNRL